MEKNEERKSGSSHVANTKTPLQKVGDFLREARQDRNLSIEDLSSSLRIGQEQLISLEEGDENSLPERVFIRAMVRRIAEKLNLDTSYILEELNKKRKDESRYSPVIKKESTKNKKNVNPFSMVILSGFLGLITSIMVLKYYERTRNDSINPQRSEVFLLDRNIYF